MAVKVLEQSDFVLPTGVVFIDFAAEWCGPCKILMPVLKDLSEKYQGIEVITTDISKNMDLAKKYRIATVPSVVVFKDGKEIDRMIGFSGREAVEKLFIKHS